MSPIFASGAMPVLGSAVAARRASSVVVPYSGPAAKFAFWPSMSVMTTVVPCARKPATAAVSPESTSVPKATSPWIARDGLCSGFRESYTEWNDTTRSFCGTGGLTTDVTP